MAKNQFKKQDGPAPKTKKRKARPAGPGKAQKLAAPFLQFLKDERTRKVTGLFLILFSACMLVAFTSFLFTWKVDQDVMLHHSWWDILTSSELQVDNWLGAIGAMLAHQFIHKWFGIASFLFVLLLFLLGFRVLFGINLLPLGKTTRYSFFALLWLSVTLGALFGDPYAFLGGSVGRTVNKWLSSTLGGIGTGFVIVFALLAFLIISFN
ncbi:MAG: DNA translocase FtsK 4TM domain-containing protein, partial [Bacteroidota bacterium]